MQTLVLSDFGKLYRREPNPPHTRKFAKYAVFASLLGFHHHQNRACHVAVSEQSIMVLFDSIFYKDPLIFDNTHTRPYEYTHATLPLRAHPKD